MSELKIVTKKEKEKKQDFSNVWVNIEFCKNIIKNKKLAQGFTLKKSDSGSQVFGAVKDAIVYLSWSPPFGTKFSTLSRPFSTAIDPKEFQDEFKKAYEEYLNYSKECYNKMVENPSKWLANPPQNEKRGVCRIKY